jgi:fatty acid desaturase
MKQQGFVEEADGPCDMHFSGLYFQPRIMFPLVLLAIILRSPAFFLILSAVLCWNVLFPRWNPFELFYNRAFAQVRGRTKLAPAPGPRRFAQGMAAAFLLLTGLSFLAGWTVAAWVFSAFLVVAFSALLFGKFCMGAYIYHLLRGRFAFAKATLPWARP